MNYYILPKNNTKLNINYSFVKEELLEPYISRSLIHFFNSLQEQLTKYDASVLTTVTMFINTYQFIYTVVPDTSISVSKIKVESNIFYELIEIFHICNLSDSLNSKPKLFSMHFTPNYSSVCYFLNIIREEKEDIYINSNDDIAKMIQETKYMNEVSVSKCDFLFFEFKPEEYSNLSHYFTNMIYTLDVIVNHQTIDGISIIKVDNIHYKLIVDILHILSGLFEKVYLIKPSVSNVISSERYVICKHFIQPNDDYHKNLKIQLSNLISHMSYYSSPYNMDPFIVNSLFHHNTPYYFINKIEESNAVIGQTQLENMVLIINTIKNRNKDDKIELMKRNNIQKCILWCEKYKIPHNKFIDKTNIFLHIKTSNDKQIRIPKEPYENVEVGLDLYITDVETALDLEFNLLLEKQLEAQIEIYEETCLNEYIDIETITNVTSDIELEMPG